MIVLCHYCRSEAKLVAGREIYPRRRDLADIPMYACLPCKAWVGCHPGTTKPLGRLANAELRQLKMKAHAAFDPLWKSGQMKRKAAYAWLAAEMEIEGHDCHIGYFSESACRRVVELCQARTV